MNIQSMQIHKLQISKTPSNKSAKYRSHTLANLTATPVRINSQRSLRAVSAHSQRSLRAVSVESQSMANPLRMRCELISTNVEEKKLFIFMIRKQVKLKNKTLFRRLIKLITSEDNA